MINGNNIDIHLGVANNLIVSNINDYNKSAQMMIFFCNKYEKNCCDYNRLKSLFILSDRYHIRMFGNTISNSRMYKYNYFLTMLKKYIEKNSHFKLKDNILFCDCIINNQIFNQEEINSLNYVFTYFKKYNNVQLSRYMRNNIGLCNYCTELFKSLNDEDEYCKIDLNIIEKNINKYNALCEYKDQLNDGKSIKNLIINK